MLGEVLYPLHVVHDEPVVEADRVGVLAVHPAAGGHGVYGGGLAVHQGVRRNLENSIEMVKYILSNKIKEAFNYRTTYN